MNMKTAEEILKEYPFSPSIAEVTQETWWEKDNVLSAMEDYADQFKARPYPDTNKFNKHKNDEIEKSFNEMKAKWDRLDFLEEKVKEQELIIYGLEEGCGEWKDKYSDLEYQLSQFNQPLPIEEEVNAALSKLLTVASNMCKFGYETTCIEMQSAIETIKRHTKQTQLYSKEVEGKCTCRIGGVDFKYCEKDCDYKTKLSTTSPSVKEETDWQKEFKEVLKKYPYGGYIAEVTQERWYEEEAVIDAMKEAIQSNYTYSIGSVVSYIESYLSHINNSDHDPVIKQYISTSITIIKEYVVSIKDKYSHIKACQMHRNELNEYANLMAREAVEKALDKGIGIGRRSLVDCSYSKIDEDYIKDETNKYLDTHHPLN